MRATPRHHSHYSIVNCLGSGTRARSGPHVRGSESGLTPAISRLLRSKPGSGAFRPGVAAVRPDLAAYDCRNNRLAQLGLEADGFSVPLPAARKRHGAERIGVFMGTALPDTRDELASAPPTRKQRTAGGLSLPGTHNTPYSVAISRGATSRPASPCRSSCPRLAPRAPRGSAMRRA